MRAVWSFWTRPFRAYYKTLWLSEKHHLLAWVLSVETARQHYSRTSLVTDDDGARVLVDHLGLRFSDVSTELRDLPDESHDWFNLGKLYAYRAQTEPFVHIDYDVFLWKPLPSRAVSSPLFAQNPEWLPALNFYRPAACTEAVRAHEGWLPEEWVSYLAADGDVAVNCGVLGGQDPAFVAYYADLAIRIIEHPRNQAAWSALKANVADAILIEQFFLNACIEHHRNRPGSAYRHIQIAYLFPSFEDALDHQQAKTLGYTHLINGAKTNRVLMQRLERRVQQDHPEYYERCLRYLAQASD
jgi:hypothetical protein